MISVSALDSNILQEIRTALALHCHMHARWLDLLMVGRTLSTMPARPRKSV